MVFNLLSLSLKDLFNCCGYKISLSMLANQILYRLQYIYSKSRIQAGELNGCEEAWKSGLGHRIGPSPQNAVTPR